MTDVDLERLKFPSSIPLFPQETELIAIIDSIALKDKKALCDLYDRKAALLYSNAHRVLYSKQDSEEVVCDVFMQVWEHAHHYDRLRGSVTGWLLGITRHRAIDRLRRRRPMMVLDDDQRLTPDCHGPEDTLDHHQTLHFVHRALAHLPSKRRHLVGLAFFQELSHEQIARQLHMPTGTVKSSIRRALKTMRTMMPPELLSMMRRPTADARSTVTISAALPLDSRVSSGGSQSLPQALLANRPLSQPVERSVSSASSTLHDGWIAPPQTRSCPAP